LVGTNVDTFASVGMQPKESKPTLLHSSAGNVTVSTS